MLVAGVDSSTQSTKVLLCEEADGTIVAQGSAPHPCGTEVDPVAWRYALQQAGEELLSRADAIGVAGQQHGMVVLDENSEVVRPALLWNDLRSAHHRGPRSLTSSAAAAADRRSFQSSAGRITSAFSSRTTMPCCWPAIPMASARDRSSSPACWSA